VRDALRTQGDEAKRVILKELKQMIDRKVFRPVRRSVLTEQERRSTIRSSMFLKAKYHPDRTFGKLKARLVAGGDQKDKSLYLYPGSDGGARGAFLNAVTFHPLLYPLVQSLPWQRWRRTRSLPECRHGKGPPGPHAPRQDNDRVPHYPRSHLQKLRRRLGRGNSEATEGTVRVCGELVQAQ
jgi:hypothetical protein